MKKIEQEVAEQMVENQPVRERGINIILNHQQVRELKPVRDQYGKPSLSFTHTLPNRAQRRQDNKVVKSRNRATTAGRYSQQVDITTKRQTVFGFEVNEPTGYIRKIVHHPVVMKVWKALMLPVWRGKQVEESTEKVMGDSKTRKFLKAAGLVK